MTATPTTACSKVEWKIKLCPNVDPSFLPCKGSAEAAGWDVRSREKVTIYPGTKERIALGFMQALPKGKYAQFFDRSSVASQDVHVLGGVVDSDFRGEVGVMLFNLSEDEGFVVERGDRIAQMVILDSNEALRPVPVQELPPSDRGTQGFGSTGR